MKGAYVLLHLTFVLSYLLLLSTANTVRRLRS